MNQGQQISPEAHVGRFNRFVAIGALTATLGLVACGNTDSDGPLLRPAEATADSVMPGDDGRTPANGGLELVLPGDNKTINDEADLTNCGVAKGETWSGTRYLNQMLSTENADLLASTTKVFEDLVGPTALGILANGAIDNPNATYLHQNNKNSIVRLAANATPVQMTDAAVAHNPNRQNNLCLNTDGEGLGDESVKRDNRSNVNNGENVTLLAASITPEAWEAAVRAAEAEGKNTSRLLVQLNTVKVKNADGKIVDQPVVQLFFLDDSCGNVVLVPETPAPTPDAPKPPEETVPTQTTAYSGPKVDPRKAPAGGTDPAEQDHGTPNEQGVGPAGQTPNANGVVPGEAPVITQPLAPADTIKPADATTTTVAEAVTPTTGTQPEAPADTVATTVPQANDQTPATVPA